jgi:hypothetical protein
MADVIFSRKDLQALQDGKGVATRYQEYLDMGYLPIPLLLDYLEKNKKSHGSLHTELKQVLPRCEENGISLIPLSANGLCTALSDPDFSEKYVNREGNPFELSTEACVYEYDMWWDRKELLSSLQEISWE